MDEVFEHNGLLTRESLRELQARTNARSAVRLALHLAALVCAGALAVHLGDSPLPAFAASVALAWIWATIFAPFHECTHRTAFRSRRANAFGAWLCGIPFAMAPGVYRAFHFEHHRHTQDPARDPEIADNPDMATKWPNSLSGWLLMVSGYGLILLKCKPLWKFASTSTSEWDEFATWVPPAGERAGIKRECQILLGLWLAFIVACFTVIDGGGWLIFALFLTHVFEAAWLVAEHTGLPLAGTIVERTRSVESNAFIRWWLWNMNYHTEHHAWPGIPWHRLGDAHANVVDKLDNNVDGYLALHREVLAARGAA